MHLMGVHLMGMHVMGMHLTGVYGMGMALIGCWDRCSNTPVGQQVSTCWLTNRPVGYGASLLVSIRKITLFGKWPALLGNGSVR
jgi:hypothetical protein